MFSINVIRPLLFFSQLALRTHELTRIPPPPPPFLKKNNLEDELADFLQVYLILFFCKKKGYEQNNLEDELADFLERV